MTSSPDSYYATLPTWIVVIESLETTDYSVDDAYAHAYTYQAAGISTDVLLSTDFSTLNPGYWVVYTGYFNTEDAAAAYCRSIRDVAKWCYQRYVDY